MLDVFHVRVLRFLPTKFVKERKWGLKWEDLGGMVGAHANAASPFEW